MNNAPCVSDRYDEFQILDDILIIHPQADYTESRELDGFLAIIDSVLSRKLESWYLIEILDEDIRGPVDRPAEIPINYYRMLKYLGCQRVILVSKLSVLHRLWVKSVIQKSKIPMSCMPDRESALDWTLYLKNYRDRPCMNTERHLYY